MFFIPERQSTIEIASKHQKDGEPVMFVLGAPNPYRYTSHISKIRKETQTDWDYSVAIVQLCLRDITPMPEGWTPAVDGLFPLEQVRAISLPVLSELADVAINNFIAPPEELEKNS